VGRRDVVWDADVAGGDLRVEVCPPPTRPRNSDSGPAPPVVLVCRTAYTAGGTPVEVNEMVLDSSAYVLEYAFEG
jgi:hypothetical protein